MKETILLHPRMLAAARAALDLSQKDLAVRANCSHQVIQQFEAGLRVPIKQIGLGVTFISYFKDGVEHVGIQMKDGGIVSIQKNKLESK